MNMRTIFASILCIEILFLIGCSNGKIENRKTSVSCFDIKNQNFGDLIDSGFVGDELLRQENRLKIKDQNFKKLEERKTEIEKEASEIYLVNTSSSNIIAFTVKTIITDNSNITTETKIYKTNPGEEISLGCTFFIDNNNFLLNRQSKIVGEVKIK